MATEEGVVPSAQEVSDSFVEQYYRILTQFPKEAHRLYVDSSVVSRPGPDGTMVSFKSVEAIDEQFLSCDYENTTFDMLSVDSQSSLEDGVFLMVIGFFTGKDNLKRKFSQMFYLARQNTTYVVLNDIFRYVDGEPSASKTLPVAESVTATEMVKPADVLNKTEPIHKINASVENSVNAVEVNNDVAGATPPLDNRKKDSDDKAVTAKKPTEPVAETVAPQLDGAKRSYAAIVQSNNPAPFQAKFPVQKPKYTGQPRVATAPKAPASVSNSEKKKDQKIIEEPGTSIFVANLPMNAMPPQLHELFKEFGPIKENGIQVRSSWASNGACFGFVAFDSATSVQSVLQAAKNNPFMLADRKLRVKEKEVEYNGSKPSKPTGKTGGGSKNQNGSADGGDEFKPVRSDINQNGSADGEDEFKPVRSRRNRNGSADGGDEFKLVRNRKNQNGAADGGDEFKPVRNRRNNGRNERRGDRKANGDNTNQKNSEGRAPEVQA